MTEPTNTQGIPPEPPQLLDGDALYNSIMGQIEPELLSVNLEAIPTLCANETPEQRTARVTRYKAAFEEYDRRFDEHCRMWDEQLHNYKREAIEYIENQAQVNDIAELQVIESSLTQ